mmetsp:Transcript_21787/g.32972  ORF Transcript_21787/g.32972 Transcript_21787/m.32972 type:complete len:247 (-) Transcript_21787:368-1108(-)
MALQFFVAIINEQLFKAVRIKDFKAVNVQDSDEGQFVRVVANRQCRIDTLDQPQKETAVRHFRQSIPFFFRLTSRLRFGNDFATHIQLFGQNGLLDLGGVQSEQLTGIVQRGFVGNASDFVFLGKCDIAQVQDGRGNAPHDRLLVRRQSQTGQTLRRFVKIVLVLFGGQSTAAVAQIMIRLFFRKFPFRQFLTQQLIKDVIIAFAIDLVTNPGLFQQVIGNLSPPNLVILKINVNELAEATGIIIL